MNTDVDHSTVVIDETEVVRPVIALARRHRHLLAGLVLIAMAMLQVRRAPVLQEDGAILLRYAQHVALGAGMTWNNGDAPVAGATDILYAWIVGMCARWMRFPVEEAAFLVGLVSHVACVLAAYWGILAGTKWGSSALAFTGAALVALGPGWVHVAHGFGTTLFALILVVAAILCRMAVHDRQGSGWVTAGLALAVLGVSRPEGMGIAVVLLAMMAVEMELPLQWPALARCALITGALVGAYLVWHTIYFGYAMPVPFYRKAMGAPYWNSLDHSMRRCAFLLIPEMLIIAFALTSRMGTRRLWGATVALVGFVAIWVLASDAQNIAWRFQYPIVPLATTLCFPLLHDALEHERIGLHGNIGMTRSLACLVLILLAERQYWRSVYGQVLGEERMALDPGVANTGLRDVGKLLSQYADNNYRLATTEAGLLPLYSQWKTLDAWGLNDIEIAKSRIITEGALASFRPDVIMAEMHDTNYLADFDADWTAMNQVIVKYARKANYRLAAVFGTDQHGVHVYYVRSELPDSEAIYQSIRKMKYGMGWSDTLNFEEIISANGTVLDYLKVLQN